MLYAAMLLQLCGYYSLVAKIRNMTKLMDSLHS